jgi:hypothetical protein
VRQRIEDWVTDNQGMCAVLLVLAAALLATVGVFLIF